MRDVTAKTTGLHSVSQLIIFIPDSALRFMGNLLVAGGRGVPSEALLERASHRLDHGEGGILVLVVRLHCDHERLLVLRVASGLAAVALAAKIGVVNLREAVEFPGLLAVEHGLHDLEFQAPGALVVHTQLPHQLQCVQFGLGGGERVDGQHSGAQRRVGAREQGARCQSRAVSAEGLGFSKVSKA